MNCIIVDNSLNLPFGTKFSIKQNGLINKQINLINGSKQNEFIAIFDENDVDFEITCDNLDCNRGIAITLTINQKRKSFYIHPQKISTFKALETNGRKLHFISQNTSDGRVMVAQTAHKYGTSYELASEMCSKIEFNIVVEVCKIKSIDVPFIPNDFTLSGTQIKLFIKTLTGNTLSINIGLNNTIYELKQLIQDKEGIPPEEQKLIFSGNLLDDERKLSDYRIPNESKIYMTLRLRGGWSAPPLTEVTDDTQHSVNTDSHTNSSDRNTNASKLLSGERGVICYGEQSNQKFNKYEDFIKDCDIRVNPFVIEMRMKSRFAPI